MAGRNLIMTTATFGPLVQQIRKLAAIQCPWTDRHLLERFAVIVHRILGENRAAAEAWH
jgi:hypothetical protein